MPETEQVKETVTTYLSYRYKGRLIEELTREELIEAFREVAGLLLARGKK